jgi:hypothetical protein
MVQLTFNPYLTTVGEGLFQVESDGLVQGTAFPDPATRNAQRTGQLASDETLPMWGGVGIYENIPGVANGPNPSLGPICGRATALTGSKALAGFSVFDGAYAMVVSPQSRVPLAGSYNQVMSYALGSRARIAVQADPALSSIIGDPIGQNVSWDFVAQRLVPYIGTLTISSGTYDNTTGLVTLTMSAPITFGSGDSVILSALTGTGAFASLNGTWTTIDPTTGTTVSFLAPSGLGATTITGGSLTLGSGASVALPCKVLQIQDSGCMTVEYNSVTGFANWNFDGAAAVIQI